MPKHSSPKPKMHLVIGKIYADWCGHCTAMSPAWNEMIEDIKNDMHLIEEKETTPLKSYKKYVSKDGKSVVEIIEMESESMDDELPYVQKQYSPAVIMQGGFPTLFKIRDNKVSYYGGERTAEKMKEWYISKPKMNGEKNGEMNGGYTRRKHRKNKTAKNKTRGRYTRTHRR